jgi:transcriptional regulator with XRE-family HTH domain
MSRKFDELRKKMSPEAQARSKARAGEILHEMALSDLRRARELTQEQVAKNLSVNQAWISRFERQTDMYISTLRSYIEGLGGELDMVARFGEVAVKLDPLTAIGAEPASSSQSSETEDGRQRALQSVEK